MSTCEKSFGPYFTEEVYMNTLDDFAEYVAEPKRIARRIMAESEALALELACIYLDKKHNLSNVNYGDAKNMLTRR